MHTGLPPSLPSSLLRWSLASNPPSSTLLLRPSLRPSVPSVPPSLPTLPAYRPNCHGSATVFCGYSPPSL
eukprot:758980-Hanusia_phi.AAC.2